MLEMNKMGFFVYTGTGTGSEQTIPHTIGMKPDVIIPILSKIDGSNVIDVTATAATKTSLYVTATNGAAYTIIAGMKG